MAYGLLHPTEKPHCQLPLGAQCALLSGSPYINSPTLPATWGSGFNDYLHLWVSKLRPVVYVGHVEEYSPQNAE